METFDNTDWVLIYSTNEIYKTDIIVEFFGENGIQTQQINKKDSNFPWGEIDIYVLQDDFEAAKQIIEQHPDL